jgi:uncharacterized protein (DUF885 family)
MLNRREALMTGAAAAGLALAAGASAWAQLAVPPAAPSGAGPEDARLRAMLDRFFNEQVQESPQQATGLGLDKGPNAPLKSRLDPRTEAEKQRRLARNRGQLAELRTIDRARLTGASPVDYDVVEYQLTTQIRGGERFAYGSSGSRYAPYVVSQLTGAYQDVPTFLDTQHQIRDDADADAYLSRLNEFTAVLDQDTERMRADVARGVVPPDFVLDLTLGQLRKLREVAPGETTLVGSLARRARAAGLARDYAAPATGIVQERVFPALDRQIAAVAALRPRAGHEAGVWRLPDGAAFYAGALEAATTTTLSPDEVHRMGLEQVAQITADIDRILRSQGMTQGTVAQRLVAAGDNPAQLFPDTDEGRAALLESLNGYVRQMSAQLPRAFNVLPKAALEIRRVPPSIQDGAPNGYYNGASLDGSRPAIYYINLKTTHDWPKFGLPTLTFHEGVPGHHLQISTAQESPNIPLIRRRGGFSAYSEGWALYAEQVADELGFYANNPLGRVGFLQSFLFRAARLVVDTGMHAKRWTREQATDYLVGATGFPRERTQREIDRYVVWPGQACSYKIGHTQWVRLRDRARQQLGARFDLRQFHEVLLEGAMPLTILERVVEARTRARLQAA